MIKSMYSGISGMKAFQEALNVTSNNISNASTTGYKKQQAMFTDLLYTNTMGGSASEYFAGTNPMSVGNGSKLSSIKTDYSAGGATTTGGLTDAALTGDGFFVVGDSEGGTNQYTRNGSFSVSENGYIVNANGQYVLGYTADANGNIISNPNPMPIEIEIGKAVPGVASSQASMSGNLPLKQTFEDGEAVHTEQIIVYNQNGEKVTLTVKFTMTEEQNENGEGTGKAGSIGVEVFDLNSANPDTPIGSIADVPKDANGMFDWSGLSLNITEAVNSADDLMLDLSKLTTLATSETITSTANGSAAKVATSYGIGDGGSVMLVYSDGSTEEVAKLAVAAFANNDGLMQQGNGCYTPGLSAGQVSLGVAGENGSGSIIGGALESSNVDLATEFVDLMVYQKGFQGSTKIITISDEILDEVVNLVR